MNKEDDMDKRISDLVDTSSAGMIFEKIIKMEDIPKIMNYASYRNAFKADAIRPRDKRDDDFFSKLRKMEETGGYND
jgi:hypothetical protein